MNAPWPYRAQLDEAARIVERRFGIGLCGVLPTETVAHWGEPYPLVLLAEKTRDDLSLVEVCSAEIELQDELGCAVRILLKSELTGGERGQAILAQAQRL